MPVEPRITSADLKAFKLNDTDENAKIAAILSDFIPSTEPGLVLDVGAGLGDIAGAVFPDRDAILIDILDFEPVPNPRHKRQLCDWFEYYPPADAQCSVMLMSHVLQYIDDDVERLNAKISELSPRSLITVIDEEDDLQRAVLAWFAEHGIRANPERPIPDFPRATEYRLIRSTPFVGTIQSPDFAHLADGLGRIIFDAPITRRQVADLSSWLRARLRSPRIEIPQTASLYSHT